jgi:hypothetical protein
MKRVDKALQVWEDSAGTRGSRDENRHTLLHQYAPEGLAHEPPKRGLALLTHGAGRWLRLRMPARLVTGVVSALAVEQHAGWRDAPLDAQVNTSLKTVMITERGAARRKTLATDAPGLGQSLREVLSCKPRICAGRACIP